MSNAVIKIDFTGNGVMQDMFHPTIDLCYIQGVIDVPPLTPSPDGFASWDFDVPGIETPFLFITEITGAETYFERLGVHRWRLQAVGQRSITKQGFTADHWRKPQMNKVGEITIEYGGFRG